MVTSRGQPLNDLEEPWFQQAALHQLETRVQETEPLSIYRSPLQRNGQHIRLLTPMDRFCLPNHLRKRPTARDRVCSGNARIEIGGPHEKPPLLAVSHAIWNEAPRFSIADCFEQLLGSEGLLQERGVDRYRFTVLPDIMMMFICGCRRRAY